LVASATVFTIAPLLYLTVSSAWLLIPIRFFHGIATAILGPVASAIICDAYPESKGAKLGFYSSTTLVGRTIAPLLGGLILSTFALHGFFSNYKMVYVGAFIIALPVFFLSLSVPKDKGHDGLAKLSVRSFFRALGEFLSHKKLLGTSFVEMATYFTFGAFETYLPIFLSEKGLPAYLIGMIFSIQVLSIALSKPFFGKLSDRIDRRIQIIIGIVILGLAIVAIPFFTHAYAVTAVSIVFGLGMSLSTVATSTYVADVARKDSLGSAMGALSAIMDIGHSSGPFVAGIVITAFASADHTGGYIPGFFACFIVCALSAIFFAALTFTGEKRK
ncbi:MAG TPA: MFS transporter, partial [Spirochaetota bacterium]